MARVGGVNCGFRRVASGWDKTKQYEKDAKVITHPAIENIHVVKKFKQA